MLVPRPFVTIIFLLSSSIKPRTYLFPCFKGTNFVPITPKTGKTTCPPCVWPQRVKSTWFGISGKRSGLCESKIIGFFVFFNDFAMFGCPHQESSTPAIKIFFCPLLPIHFHSSKLLCCFATMLLSPAVYYRRNRDFPKQQR